MVDPCRSNPLECLNNGKCVASISLNTSYCQCDPCHNGNFCENDVWRQPQFDTTYVYLIVFIISLCFSVLNNSLGLEVFIRCKRIRHTNGGIYLIVYSIFSLLSSILLVVDQVVQYYPNQLMDNTKQYNTFHCYVTKIGYNMFVDLCIWFSSCVALERGLVIYYDGKKKVSRWRSFITIIVMFAIAGGSATPLLFHNCDWDNVPNLQIARDFFVWFYVIIGITIYVLATLLVLIGFVRHIRQYGMENGSPIKTFLKLLRSHLFIFVPPVAYAVSYIPYTIVINTKNPNHSYYQCGISTGEFTIKVLMETLTGIPVVMTWLLFVYPSKVYMTEFYLNTWSGQCLAKILLVFGSCSRKEKNTHLPAISPSNNEQEIRA